MQHSLFWGFLSWIGRAAFRLRYRVTLKGFEALDRLDPNGILFLPNHPAHMDPPLLFLYLWNRFRMRPVVIDYIYRLKPFKILMKIVRAVSIPNFDTSINQYKVYKAEKSLKEVADGLRQGDNFVLYPAGRLKFTGREQIGGASGTHAILQECPDTPIVLIRTSGLWGSCFSRAFEGGRLSLGRSLLYAFKALLQNFFFFMPRRDVQIECEVNPPDFPRGGSRLEINRYLENWYNRYLASEETWVEEEPLNLVSYTFWKKTLPEMKVQEKKSQEEIQAVISDEARKKIYGEISRILNRESPPIEPHLDLAMDLGMDSLEIAELIAFLSQNFEMKELHPEELITVQNILEAVARTPNPSDRSKATAQGAGWPEEAGRSDPVLPVGETIPEAFLRSCQRMGRWAACGDDASGVLSYKRLKMAVLVLADALRKLPGKNIGVLLPASVGSYVTVLALQFAGKTPVMLNWTLGSRYLDEMGKAAELQVVLTSWRFLEKASHVELGSLVEKVLLLEDIRSGLSLKSKLKGAFFSRVPYGWALRAYPARFLQADDPAVILFTSGTEAAPKGVPLSHRNILSNLRSAMQCLELSAKDVLFGILPPFHSFGFSVAGLFSLLAGIRIAMYPDPTDSFALAEGIERWKITLFCSPPTFIKSLFRTARPEQLQSVRWFVSGAEKAPPELFERVEQLGTGAKLMEGYGITECSPILTMTRPNLPAKGVGRPIPVVEIRTIHIETQEPLEQGEEGEICVRGPNVFQGYLGHPRDPFIEIEGEKWYRTGDIGYLDPEGNLIISGRLKRFTKIGGEMISLGAVEGAIQAALIEQGRIGADTSSLALCAVEQSLGKTDLVLFSIVPFTPEEANEILQKRGFSRLVKISSIQQVPEIPIMGTGKIDYRKLQATLTGLS